MKKIRKKIGVLLSACIILSLTAVVNVFAESDVVYQSDFSSYNSVEDLIEKDNWCNGEVSGDGWKPTLYDDTENGAKYIRTVGEQGIMYALPETITDGRVKITGTMRMTGGNSAPLFEAVPEKKTNNQPLGLVMARIGGGNMHTQMNPADKTLGAVMADKWYDVSAVLDLESGTYNVQLIYNGNVIASYRGLDSNILDAKDGSKVTTLKYVRLRSWGGTTDLRSLKIEKIDKETSDECVIASENFEDVTYIAGHKGNSYFKIGKTSSWLDDEDIAFVNEDAVSTSRVLKMLPNNSWSGITRTFPTISAGKYKFTFDVYVNGTQIMITAGPSKGGDGLNLAYVSAEGDICHTKRWKEANNVVATAPMNSWVTVENIIDISNKKITYTVKDANGTQIGKTVTVSGYGAISDDGKLSSDDFNTFRVVNWNASKVAYLDNFRLEYYIEKPSLSVDRISMTDKDGETITNYASSVTPAIKDISLDFGCDLKASSLEGAITLAPSNGTPVECDYEIANGKYILKPKALLSANTKYELTVAPTVSNTNGDILGTEFKLEFTTSKIDSVIRLSGATINGEQFTALSQLTSGAKIVVNTDVTNADTVSKNLIYIAAYYSGNLLKDVEAKTSVVSAGAISAESQTFTAPTDITGIDSVKIFLWDTKESMKPYCEPIAVSSSAK